MITRHVIAAAAVIVLVAGCASPKVHSAQTVEYVLVHPRRLTAPGEDGAPQVLVEASFVGEAGLSLVSDIALDRFVVGASEVPAVEAGVALQAPSIVANVGETADVLLSSTTFEDGATDVGTENALRVELHGATADAIDLEITFGQHVDSRLVRSAGPVRVTVPTGRSVLVRTD